jgi:precorrin-3B synthase
MTAFVRALPQRRGACPGLSAPMLTGDGLLARFMPIGTVSLAAFSALCALARKHGNGVMEITSRGSIQVRGLNAATAPRFADDVAALDIAAADGVPVLTNALTGLDASEHLDAGIIAANLRRAITQHALNARLNAKVSVAIDSGSAPGLEKLAADIRLCAQPMNGNNAVTLAVGGDAASAARLGVVAAADAVEAAARLLDIIAAHGREARARDVVTVKGTDIFETAINALLIAPASPARINAGKTDAIGRHHLRDGKLACGIGLAFGHAGAQSLEDLADAAAAAGASGMRPAPGRALMAIGLTAAAAPAFIGSAERLGFIVRADDPRRHVVACAGAPICASAHIASRAMAPQIAEIAAPHLGDAFIIHLSGCSKGCAHSASAGLTVVGTPDGCALVSHGTSHDAPFAVAATHELPATIAKHVQEQMRVRAHV